MFRKEVSGRIDRTGRVAGALTEFFTIWRFPLGKATKKSEGLVRIFLTGSIGFSISSSLDCSYHLLFRSGLALRLDGVNESNFFYLDIQMRLG
jgi:hypothetical protein